MHWHEHRLVDKANETGGLIVGLYDTSCFWGSSVARLGMSFLSSEACYSDPGQPYPLTKQTAHLRNRRPRAGRVRVIVTLVQHVGRSDTEAMGRAAECRGDSCLARGITTRETFQFFLELATSE